MPLAISSVRRAAPIAALILLLAALGMWTWRQGGGSPSGGAVAAAAGDRTVRITETGPLRIGFPVPMNAASVEEHVRIDDDLNATWTWDGNDLVLSPSEPLVLGEEFTVTVGAEALRSDGVPLGRDLTTHVIVAGPPSVAHRQPKEGTTGVHPSTPVRIVFDRPMIALQRIQDQPALAGAFSLQPQVPGRWHWISTTTAEFTPETALAPATEYTVSVDGMLRDIHGAPLAAGITWTFVTRRPGVLSSEPPDGFDVAGPRTEIVLTFSQAVDLASVERATRFVEARDKRLSREQAAFLREGSLAQDIAVPVPFRAVYGRSTANGKTVEDRSIVVLVPQRPLRMAAWHTVVVDDGITSPGGRLGSEKPYIADFRTANPMRMQNARFEYGTLTVTFNNPIDMRTVKKGVTFTPEPPGWKDMEFADQGWEESTLWLTLPWEPSETYEVSVNAGLKDVFGQSAEAASSRFVTPQIPPRAFIHSQGTFGVFERGKPPVFYLNAVNVSRSDVVLAKLDLPAFLHMQREAQADWEYAPDLGSLPGSRKWQLPHEAAQNAWSVIPFDVQERMGAPLEPGIYAMTLTAPEYRQEWNRRSVTERVVFTLTDIALTLKYSGHHALVWAADMQTGRPIPGAAIAVHDLNGATVLRGTTDAQGFFETPLPLEDLVGADAWNPEFWVTAQKNGDFAMVGSTWNNGMYPGDFDLPDGFTGGAGEYHFESFVYTDRPLYRAGDTVGFKGILRLRDGMGALVMPRGRSARVRIEDPESNVVYSQILPISDMGSFHAELPLDAAAKLGAYWIWVEADPGDGIVNNGQTSSFQVLAYRKPEYSVDVTFPAEDAYDGDTVEAVIDGQYYFGAPMAGASVTWRAVSTDYFFNRFTDGWYSFSLEDAWCWWDCARETEFIAEGAGALDASGKLAVKVPVNLADQPLSQILSIDAEVTDQNNQIVAARGSLPVHKAALYVGIRSETYAVEPGEEAEVGLVTVRPDGSPAPNTPVQLQLFSRQWTSVRTKNVDGQYYYENTPTDTLLATASAITGRDGKVTAAMTVPSGGAFRILATVRDGEGREAKADTSVYAWSSTYVNWPRMNSNRVTVVADKPEYAVGDTAKLLVQSPFQGPGVTALVTVEREQVMQWTLLPVDSAAQSIEIPVTADMIPNAYVSVVILKPRQGETFNEHGLDTGAPAFRIGYVRLKVDTSSKQLTVDVQPDKRRYAPGETVEVLLRTSNASGQPVPAEVSLAAVDMSVLALAGFRVPDVLGFFFADRPLGVRSAQSLLYLLERFKPGSKGGGGADGEDRTRGVFKDTAYWNPSIRTDERGEARVQFTLPDNLTTWQLLAIGHTRDTDVGAYATEIVETKRVIVRPVRPRFAVIGDQAELGAIVVNGLPERRTFRVKLSGAGFTGKNLEQEVTVDPDAQVKVTFPVTFSELGGAAHAEFVFLAETEGARDELRERIPVVAFGVPQAVATSGFTDASAAEKIFLPPPEEIASASLEATLSATLAAYLPKGLEFLVQFPYGCAEQTVSSFLPNVAVAKLQGFDAFRVVSDAELEEKISTGIQRLYGFQRSDGGFGYWAGSFESFPYLTAYVLHALWQTRQAGYAVDADSLTRARDYLRGFLREKNPANAVDLSERAYILFVLSETGSPDVSLLNNLYGRADELPLFGKAYLAMSYEKAGNHRRAVSLLDDVIGAADITARGAQFGEAKPWQYRVLMHTNARTTAIVAQAITRINPSHALLPDVIRGMLSLRAGGHWDTTQSTTMSIFALVEYLKVTGELNGAFGASLRVDGEDVAKAAFDAASILEKKTVAVPLASLTAGTFTDVEFAKSGAGRLYYDLLLRYVYRAETIEPAEEGMSIVRTLEPVAGSPAQPTVGGTYKVTLTVTVPAERHFVAVESPHPAGFEGIDFALQTSQRRLEDELREDADSPWSWEPRSFTHTEFRDDQVFLFADTLPAGVHTYEYLVRATLPGRFRLRPARAYEMYFPEIFGNTEGGWMTVRTGI